MRSVNIYMLWPAGQVHWCRYLHFHVAGAGGAGTSCVVWQQSRNGNNCLSNGTRMGRMYAGMGLGWEQWPVAVQLSSTHINTASLLLSAHHRSTGLMHTSAQWCAGMFSKQHRHGTDGRMDRRTGVRHNWSPEAGQLIII